MLFGLSTPLFDLVHLFKKILCVIYSPFFIPPTLMNIHTHTHIHAPPHHPPNYTHTTHTTQNTHTHNHTNILFPFFHFPLQKSLFVCSFLPLYLVSIQMGDFNFAPFLFWPIFSLFLLLEDRHCGFFLSACNMACFTNNSVFLHFFKAEKNWHIWDSRILKND